ncbi:serine hydrolase domain-containing protein [Desulfurivibrio dismutans]|uniref:serine hydrolase domain-containing protein n=1 Tax=Desulfurivibrio dismutans TaxID=1398908 RepID=UPI0023DCE656|nr:serine hydrolase domain-containing protein [Desulfurivibrio alkaliphilus]MDF1613892.1 serine hydrolase [Desulfurivibrio alkaliphilus]
MKNFFSQQNKILENFFFQALAQGVFPGAAMAVAEGTGSRRHRLISCWGETSYQDNAKQKINEKTFFDLASLTKPLATLPAVLSLMTAGKFGFDTNLEELLAVKVPPDKKKITLKDILTHRSGLAAYYPFYEQIKKARYQRVKKEITEIILDRPLAYPPGSRSVYSDLGFILAGFIVEEHSGKNLAAYVEEDFFCPLGIDEQLFFNFPGRVRPGIYAAGEYCLWRRRLLRGEVGDENCALLGGAAGHAGLFGSISAVVRLLEYMFDLGWGETGPASQDEFFKREYFLQCCRRWDESGKNTWAAGFDTPSPGNSSGGPYLSVESIGHLGYAGTSIWMDPRNKLIMVLLTNRVHPCRSNNKIKKIRPNFHRLVMEQLGMDN